MMMMIVHGKDMERNMESREMQSKKLRERDVESDRKRKRGKERQRDR